MQPLKKTNNDVVTEVSSLSKQPVLVLPQVTDNFDRQDFNKMCWTLCSRKNLNLSRLIISNDDAFKIWCIFNFLSEEQYPLVIITEEVSVQAARWGFHESH